MTLSVSVGHGLDAFSLEAAFTCDRGITALFGPSGAGKTSLVNIIAGLLRPQRGRIALDDWVLCDTERGIHVPPRERGFGYVFQEGRLFPHLSVRQNLCYSSWFPGRGASAPEFDHVVGLLGIGDLLERRPARLSGGERQRVAIGRALLARPRLLLLDEPLASLDTHRRNEILQYLELLRDELRIPAIYVSHSVEEVVRLASSVVLVAGGRIVASGGVEEIMGRPDLRALTGVFDGGAVIEGRVIAQDMHYDLASVSFDGGTLTVTNLDALVGEPVRVRVRARDVSIALNPPRRASFQNVLRATITAVSAPVAGVADVTLSAGATVLRARVTRRAIEQLALAPGQEVYALIKAVSLDRFGLR